MIPCHLTIRAEVLPSEEAEEIDFDITFGKIKFWFETIVSRSVVFCRSNKTAIDMMLQDGNRPRMMNHMMITPFEPTDEHLAVLFQSKMEALSEGKINFGCIRVESDSSHGLVFTYVGDWKKDLPEMKDWFSTTPYYFETPWWTRDDVSTIDMIVGDIDVDIIPPWAFKLDFIKTSMRPNVENTESVVIKGAFRPKVIDGGRNDDP